MHFVDNIDVSHLNYPSTLHHTSRKLPLHPNQFEISSLQGPSIHKLGRLWAKTLAMKQRIL